MNDPRKGALSGIVVVDFSTLLPGPLASLMLADAGARVIKIERPNTGDEMRAYSPKMGKDSTNFALLNRGKESLEIDLKTADGIAEVMKWIKKADVVIEQFRPGVMARLGLGYDHLREINPALIYCSISGYGQTGPKANKPGHDLNYMAETGVLNLTKDGDGNPSLPHLLTADIAGGAYPAVMNIMMGLWQRVQTGEGAYLDISMCDNIFPMLYWALGEGFSSGKWPKTGEGLVVGGSIRYRIFRTKDGRHLATANLEEKFWKNFCQLIMLPSGLGEHEGTALEISYIIEQKTAVEWEVIFKDQDVCCSIVQTLENATTDEHVKARGIFDRIIEKDSKNIPALPLPIAEIFKTEDRVASFPNLGDKNSQ